MCSLVAGIGVSESLASEQSPWAAGLQIGSPTGFSVRYELDDPNLIDASIGWNLGSSGGFEILSAYHWQQRDWFKLDTASVAGTVGGGFFVNTGATESNKRSSFGVRAVGGLLATIRNPALEVALQLGLGIGFVPSTEFRPDGGIALRYRF